jgi:hypothetical protein
VQTRREPVASPSGEKFLIGFSPSGNIDTTCFYAGTLFGFHKYAPWLDLLGWVRNKVQRQGRWIVAGARLVDGRSAALVHSSYEPDQKRAQAAVKDPKRKIQTGAITKRADDAPVARPRTSRPVPGRLSVVGGRLAHGFQVPTFNVASTRYDR